jgi:hypothetical protein
MKSRSYVWRRTTAALSAAVAWRRDQAIGGNPESGNRGQRFFLLGLLTLVVFALTPIGPAFAKKAKHGVAAVTSIVLQYCTAPIPGTNSGCIGGVCGQTGSMEGALKVAPGDKIDAGYNFKVNNTTGATITDVRVSGRVVFPVKCPDGTFDYLVVPLNNNSSLMSPTTGGYGDELAMAPAGSNAGLNCDNNASPDATVVGGTGDGQCHYMVPAGSSQLPASSQNSPLTYQSGAWLVPATLCGGVAGNVNAGVVFKGTITTADLVSPKDTYTFQFHYGSTNSSGHGLFGTSVSSTFTPGTPVCVPPIGVTKSCGLGTFNGDVANTVTYPIFGAITDQGSQSDSGFSITDVPALDAGSLSCYIAGAGTNAATCIAPSVPPASPSQPGSGPCGSFTINGGQILCYQGTYTSGANPPPQDTITVTDTFANNQQASAQCTIPAEQANIFVTKTCKAELVPDPEGDGQIVVKVLESGTITNITEGSCSNSSGTTCTFTGSDSQSTCKTGEECGSAGLCFIPCSVNADCGTGNTCSMASSSQDDGLTNITLTDDVPGQAPNRPITLTTTTLAPGASETWSSSYYPTDLGICMGTSTPCVQQSDCTGGSCVPADLPDTVTVSGECNSVVCQGTATDTASCKASICPTCPNCPFNLQ